MIEVTCRRCLQELTSLGALILGVPDTAGRVYKQHLCFECYNDLVYWLGKGKV